MLRITTKAVCSLLDHAPHTAIDALEWLNDRTDRQFMVVWCPLLIDLHWTDEPKRDMLVLIRQIHARMPHVGGRAVPPERWSRDAGDCLQWLSVAPRATVAKFWPDAIEAAWDTLTTGTLARCLLAVRTRVVQLVAHNACTGSTVGKR